MIIGICDDIPVWIEKIKIIVTEYMEKRNIQIYIQTFDTADSLYKYLEKDKGKMDILLQDIYLGGESGINLVKRVNEILPKCQIVYLTNYISYAQEVYETGHIYFLLKQNMEERIDRVFQKVFRTIREQNQQLQLKLYEDKSIHILHLKELLYMERNLRVTIVYAESGQYKVKERLEPLMEQAGSIAVCRCHNSYCVYLPAVKEFRSNKLLLQDNMEIPISRKYAKSTKEAFAKWSSINM